jgi:cytochrome c-type biogenesis protein CcmE
MKKIHIIAIIAIAAGIGLLSTATGDFATYASFKEAAEKGVLVKVAGQLSKDKPMEYDPQKNPDLFSFYLKDKDGTEQKVLLKKAKPQDFELSEQVVCTGEMKNGTFVANDVLMKCPSKYKDEEIYMKKK